MKIAESTVVIGGNAPLRDPIVKGNRRNKKQLDRSPGGRCHNK
jgi:hypothetical protein